MQYAVIYTVKNDSMSIVIAVSYWTIKNPLSLMALRTVLDVVGWLFGALRRIRTAGLSLRRGPLYPAELSGRCRVIVTRATRLFMPIPLR